MSRYDTTWEEIEIPRRELSPLAKDVVAGAATGELAGLVMLATMMLSQSLLFGKTLSFPLQVIGSFFFGDAAIDGLATPAAFAGLILHLAGPSLFWGVVFGLVVHATGLRRDLALVALGPAVGLAAHAIDVNLILPAVYTQLHGHDIWAQEILGLRSWLYHLVFGLMLTRFGWIHERLFGASRPPEDPG